MPVMDGYTAARNIRSNGIQTPIIAITAKATVEQSELVTDAAMQCVLFKVSLPIWQQMQLMNQLLIFDMSNLLVLLSFSPSLLYLNLNQ
jgi:CheY-like chemotaxis protein